MKCLRSSFKWTWVWWMVQYIHIYIPKSFSFSKIKYVSSFFFFSRFLLTRGLITGEGVMVAGQIRFPKINWFLSHQLKNDLWFQCLYSQTKHWAPDEMLASYWMMAMSGLVITRLTAQIPRITSREWRVVSRGVSGCRMLMYLGKQIT